MNFIGFIPIPFLVILSYTLVKNTENMDLNLLLLSMLFGLIYGIIIGISKGVAQNEYER